MDKIRRFLVVAVAATPIIFGAVAAKAADIVDTAVSAGKFNTLVTAVKAAGLVETLKGDGPFTVFAPTDAAFAKLPKGTVEDLLKPEKQREARCRADLSCGARQDHVRRHRGQEPDGQDGSGQQTLG